jgi:hypothetical protein
MALRSQKRKKKYIKRKVSLRYFSPTTNSTSTTKITPDRAQAPLSPNQKISGFHPKNSFRSQNNASNKVIARNNQLRPDLEFSS